MDMKIDVQIADAKIMVNKEARFSNCHFLYCDILCNFGLLSPGESISYFLPSTPEFLAVFDKCKFDVCLFKETGSLPSLVERIANSTKSVTPTDDPSSIGKTPAFEAGK